MGLDEGEHFLHNRDTSITPRDVRFQIGTPDRLWPPSFRMPKIAKDPVHHSHPSSKRCELAHYKRKDRIHAIREQLRLALTPFPAVSQPLSSVRIGCGHWEGNILLPKH